MHQIGRNISAYVEDILVKSSNMDKHLEDHEETLDTLKQYEMKVNLAKCSFGIKEGVFLGFYIGKKAIQGIPNPEKIQVVLDMTLPWKINEYNG